MSHSSGGSSGFGIGSGSKAPNDRLKLLKQKQTMSSQSADKPRRDFGPDYEEVDNIPTYGTSE